MRFQLIGRTKAKFCDVKPQAKKNGQKELQPAVKIRVLATVANTVLEMFDPSLRPFLYEKNGQGAKEQKQLEGIPVVSDLPQLREAGVKLGALHWDDEQTGATLRIDHGLGGPSNIVLGDCTVSAFKLVPKDGGTTQVFFTVFTTDVDRETLGDLAMLHQHSVEIELIAAEVAQQSLDEKDERDATDIFAAGAQGGGNPFGESLAQGNAAGTPTREDVFGKPKNDTVVSMKKRRSVGKGLGTDADQAERQAETLAQDPSQRADWPFPNDAPDVAEVDSAAAQS